MKRRLATVAHTDIIAIVTVVIVKGVCDLTIVALGRFGNHFADTGLYFRFFKNSINITCKNENSAL